ncbi:MAG: hypothetical protein JM58_09525 [Peptococcaceae bacterium BICA1-8]|nr:MAG: hypothetical protein JM58_09525 [Peptococcaceae bacterium BICA1-8]
MELTNITESIMADRERVINSIKVLWEKARAKALSEMEYRKALQVEILLLKENKMAVTLISDIARGECAELKYKRDLAEAEYKVAVASLSALETSISSLQSILRYQTDIES